MGLMACSFLQVSVRLKSVQPRDPDTQPHGTDDMTTLSYLSEPGVLYNLKCRYGVDEIYVRGPLQRFFFPCSRNTFVFSSDGDFRALIKGSAVRQFEDDKNTSVHPS